MTVERMFELVTDCLVCMCFFVWVWFLFWFSGVFIVVPVHVRKRRRPPETRHDCAVFFRLPPVVL